MSYIYIDVPDAYPGRCLNYRWSHGSRESMRCLDYEDTRHVCTFAEPDPPVVAASSVISSRRIKEPEPWVKPGDKRDDQGTD
jgi:hypothetical protein